MQLQCGRDEGVKVFVTGGAGYVGSHCCKRFAEAGWEVVVYDNLSRGWREFVRWGPLVEGDILDEERLTAAIREARPDAIAHFAAIAYVGESVTEPDRYYRNNSTGALNVLDAMRKTGVEKILFSSTCATYGTPQKTPIDETHPQAPINPYGWSKLFVEKALADYAHAFGMRYTSLRYFNAAGADPGGEIGERHEPETHLIPLVIRGILDPDFTLSVLGDDFPTRDGTAVRDYVHVADLGEAHYAALKRLEGGGGSETFNLGTGVGTSVAEAVAAAERVTGRPVKRRIAQRRPGDPPELVAAAAKARDMLGWRPAHSGIDDIIRSAFDWHSRGG
ncbi:MAG: UDP-glucose 4-epimerase GalE [Hyphomonadaceae bacterium]|nr:UDP-glucose 4-epimerase GalE [Hyphomonadaceae bacterium]